MNATQASEYLTISERKLRDLVRLRAVPFHRVGRRLVFHRPDLDVWLDEQRVA